MGCRKWFGFDKVRKMERKNLLNMKSFSSIATKEDRQTDSENVSFKLITHSELRLTAALLEILKFEKTFNVNLEDHQP